MSHPTIVNGGYWLSNTAGKLPASNIDATLYTHLFCGYAEINATSHEVTIPSTEVSHFSEKVKMSNPNVKTLLSITGDSKVFSDIAKVPTARDTFIKSSIKAAVNSGFDGLDLQWLYPSSPTDMQNFETLIGKWRQAVVDDARTYNRAARILVASVPNLPYIEKNVEYPGEAIKQNLDWVNLVCYDFYTPAEGSSAGNTGPSSALFNRNNGSLSACFGIESWTKYVPATKIVFGIPFHGWAWQLADPPEYDVFSKASGPAASDVGYVIGTDGQMEYSEVKKFIGANACKGKNIPNDPRFGIAYAYANATWIAYESESTIPVKIELAKQNQLLGYFAWNISGDDDVNTLYNAAKTNWH
ncbi:acidic mammalian chitinase-like [Momordica charantia]|uniref:Acidic mammalian chitinase-like n=1 Tax=Momordica charantia TaxID=3673 RepID=A0A6J1CQ95_MOMCH|nr:acidic mammalian chitinase-like [Momordica charantia]